MVSYDDNGRVIDFGALEVQAVYISGNMRNPFKEYIRNAKTNFSMDWTGNLHYPRADYLSSSRKRLLPQLLYKGKILETWNKKISVAIHKNFFNTLPNLPEVSPEKADIAWQVYDLIYNQKDSRYTLERYKTIYTSFNSALETITSSSAGHVDDFITLLQNKLDERLDSIPPITPTINETGEE